MGRAGQLVFPLLLLKTAKLSVQPANLEPQVYELLAGDGQFGAIVGISLRFDLPQGDLQFGDPGPGLILLEEELARLPGVDVQLIVHLSDSLLAYGLAKPVYLELNLFEPERVVPLHLEPLDASPSLVELGERYRQLVVGVSEAVKGLGLLLIEMLEPYGGFYNLPPFVGMELREPPYRTLRDDVEPFGGDVGCAEKLNEGVPGDLLPVDVVGVVAVRLELANHGHTIILHRQRLVSVLECDGDPCKVRRSRPRIVDEPGHRILPKGFGAVLTHRKADGIDDVGLP